VILVCGRKLRPQRSVFEWGFLGTAPHDRAWFSSHSEWPSVTAMTSCDRYYGSMQIRSLKPKPESRILGIRQNAAAVSIDLRILILRRQRVILDTALAELYNVPVKRLNEQAKRNRKRFPADFMFQLTPRENKSLRSQFATAKIGRGGRRSLPYAFTEHGAIMAATVLNSEQAVEMSVFVVRAFVRLREMLAANKELAPG